MAMAKPKTPARKKPRACILPLKDLLLLPELQMRAGGLNEDHAADMAEAVKKGTKLPRVRVFELTDRDGMKVVTDGFHTCEGTKRAGRATVACEVHQGTWFEAVLDAAGANKNHLGLKRTNADKRRAVERLVDAIAASGERMWAKQRIADHVGVGDDLVRSVLNLRSNDDQLPDSGSSPSSDGKTLGADGKLRGPKHQAPKAEPESGPDAWRSIPLTKFIKAADHIWGTLDDAGITKAGQLYDALKKGETFGFAKGDLEALRKEVEGVRSAEKEEPEAEAEPTHSPVDDADDSEDEPPTPPTPTSPPPAAPAAQSPPAKRVQDRIGVDIPEPLVGSWEEERDFIKDFRKMLEDLIGQLEEARQRPYLAECMPAGAVEAVRHFADEMDAKIKFYSPHFVCPHVEEDGRHREAIGPAKKCRVCRGANFLPKSNWDQLSSELKQLAENRRKAA